MNIDKSKIFLIILIFGISSLLHSQTLFQNIRGTITDKISQSPISGAIVVVLNSNPLQAVSTDANGNFKIAKVAVGKQSLKISFLGYKEILMQNLEVRSGKELVLNIDMEEDPIMMNEVKVTAEVEKNKALNEMSTVSTRTFSVEETQRFAAAANDPARMATSFAGVISGDDGNNEISIRGNNPIGLLWRMEGVEIPNPNHFSNIGTSGGGISILSAQVLGNSDFSTGAFAAEYGNALSGVFDMKLRKGNNEKKEYTFKLGLLGTELSAEGPIYEGYKGSYLINYRYSTLSMLAKIGVPLYDAILNFQDMSLNLFLPTKKYGNFEIFGFGGLSSETMKAKKDSLKWDEDSFFQYNSKFYSNTGAISLSNTKLFNNRSYLKTALVLSGTQNGEKDDKIEKDLTTFKREYEEKFLQSKLSFSATYTQKINSLSSIRSGLILSQAGYNLSMKDAADTVFLVDRINGKGKTEIMQAFFQWNYRINKKLTSNIGMHYLHLFLNNTHSAEPRVALKYDLSKRQSLSIGYGLHSQMQPLGLYYVTIQTGALQTMPNKNLGLNKAHHIVLGYDMNINEYIHIKTELYYQHLFNIPVGLNKAGSYSVLNYWDVKERLANNGHGKNYGYELSFERFLHNNFYSLLSVSLFDSKYKAADDRWYNTRFNTNYASSLTFGKEWILSERWKKRIIGIDIKSLYIGGLRYTPINLEASVAAGEVKYYEDKAYTLKNPDYYRLDFKISLKRNYKKISSILSLDLQNATNHKNAGGQYFDERTGKIKYWYQMTMLPILSYKLEF
ncbi:MAG: TonB-dependent receptor [Bacteroidales bacterium]|nr:TonB-dependent receptor [Bacteroidales bacterium]